MTMPTIPSGTGGKSFWSKPEGKTAALINIVLLGAGIYFWGSIVPFLLSAAEDTLHLIVVCIAIGAILFVAFDKNVRRFVWYLYKALMRMITSWFVNIDPIGILKSILEKFKDKKEELEASVGEIKGQRIKLNRALSDNKAAYATSMGKMSTAQRQKDSPNPDAARNAQRILALESKQVLRLETMIKQQEENGKKYDFVVQVLTRYGEVCDDAIVDLGNEIKFRQQERDTARSFQSGMRAAMGILRGMPEDQEMQDMARESIERDYTQRMGEVENILDLTKNVIVQADFNDSTAMEKAMASLDKWKGENAGVQMGKASKGELVAAAETSAGVETKTPAPAEMDEFFK